MDNRTEKLQARSDLFQPVSLGPYRLANRIVMAPLTRSRASEDGVSDFLNGGILRAARLRRAHHR